MSQANTPQELVIVERRERVGYLTLNRPDKRNALDIPMRQAISAGMTLLSNDSDILCIVITGGNEVFAAGADLKILVDKDAQGAHELDLASYWEPLATCPKPIIAAVSGYALGAGCELIMMCDIVIADDSAKLGQTECNVGIMPGAGGTQRLVRAVGKPLASLMLMTGEMLDAQRALQAGLVSEVVKRGDAIIHARKLAARITKMPPMAIAAIKRTLSNAADLPLDQALDIERQEFLALFDTADKTEGMTAFLEKRKPVYKGN